MSSFYYLLANTAVTSVTNMTVWFALIFFLYLQSQSVFVTSVLSGLYLAMVAVSGIWFGSLVDHQPKKRVMVAANLLSALFYLVALLVYLGVGTAAFSDFRNPVLWSFTILVLLGVIVGNLRGIVMPTLVTQFVVPAQRDKANGLVGTVNGIGFMITSVISGILVGYAGMLAVFGLAIGLLLLTLLQLLFQPLNWSNSPVTATAGATGDLASTVVASTSPSASPTSQLDLAGTFRVINQIPGLLPLIFFNMFNNFLGGVFMALMDAYGLSLVTVQTWGLIWGVLSSAFIVGGAYITRFGLGKNPVQAMFLANMMIWSISSVFTIYPSIILLATGMFIYMAVVPFIQAAEFTIIQKVVPSERQGRVFGFAQSVEQAAAPLTAFAIGPLTQFVVIPFMTTGLGVTLLGPWFGTGPARAMALVFTVAGVIGLLATILAVRSKYYRQLATYYLRAETTAS